MCTDGLSEPFSFKPPTRMWRNMIRPTWESSVKIDAGTAKMGGVCTHVPASPERSATDVCRERTSRGYRIGTWEPKSESGFAFHSRV